MFYDLKKPLDFAKIISETLNEEEGLWIFEQSYLPTMLKNASMIQFVMNTSNITL